MSTKAKAPRDLYVARARKAERARLRTAAILEDWLSDFEFPHDMPEDWAASAAAFRLAVQCARRYATSLGGDIAAGAVTADLAAVKAFCELWLGRAEAMAGDHGGESA